MDRIKLVSTRLVTGISESGRGMLSAAVMVGAAWLIVRIMGIPVNPGILVGPVLAGLFCRRQEAPGALAGRIDVARVEPGDVIFLTMAGHSTATMAQASGDVLRGMFPGHKCGVLAHGCDS